MSALTTDPLHTVYGALERHGADPRGPEHKFTARCPAHDDRSPSLAVREGADGRALVYCHAGCDTEAVIAALGLQWADLFPPGHRRARRSPVLARPRPVVDLVLQALRELGIDYRCTREPDMWVAGACPACELGPHIGALWIIEEQEKVRLACMHGCPQEAILVALTGARGVVA